MMWGCMMACGAGIGCQIEGTMTAEVYMEILERFLLGTFEAFELDSSDYIFQHDGDSKHTSNLAKNWLLDHNIKVLTWPAQSPDLNPIKHLWALLKRQLARYDTVPNGTAQLWERARYEWEQITAEDCLGLIESMPERIAAVLKAKGRWTRY